MSVTYHGGGLLPHVEVQGLYVGDQWSAKPTLYSQTGYLEGFLHKIVDSTYMDALSNAGYGVGRGSSSRGTVSLASLPANTTLSDSTLRSWLGAYAASGVLQPPDDNRLYVCFVEPNIIVQGPDGATSAGGFRGYHSAFWNNSTNTPIHYAVIAYPRGLVGNAGVSFLSDVDSMTATASSEIAESATDPYQGYSTLGWYDDAYGSEIGDINNDRVMYIGGYAMQRVVNQRDFNMTPAEATSNRFVSFVLQSSGNLVEVIGGVANPVTGSVASLSDQGIDNLGHAMVDIVDVWGYAWEYHDQGGWTYLGNGITSAKAGQGVSYLLYNDGIVRRYDDATGSYAYIDSNGAQIDAGTDVQGVNKVDIVFNGGNAWEHSDDVGWRFIASSVSRISAGRQGISEYVNYAAEGHWHTLAGGGLDATFAFNVSQITAGTDEFGNSMIDVLYQTGRIAEFHSGSGWSTITNSGQAISKAQHGVLGIVFTWGAAYNHDSSGWHFLTGSAVTAA